MVRYRVEALALQRAAQPRGRAVFYTASLGDAVTLVDALGGLFRVTRQSRRGNRWHRDGGWSTWTWRTRQEYPTPLGWIPAKLP